MNDEPPSSLAESQRLGITKKIKEKIREIYQNFSYKPQSKQEIAGSIRDSSNRGVLEKGTLRMMEGALKVSTAQVREIMIPKPQIIFVDSSEEPEEFLPRIIRSRHSRFPVFNKETEKIEGILLAKDLLPLLSPKNKTKLELRNLLRPAVLVPESKKLNTLLDGFRASRNHMAIVIDEYGGITGLVTIEDVLEEIVGEIEDEHDDLQDQMVKKVSNKEFLVSALIPIDEFNEEFNSKLSNKDFDTLGGIVMHHFTRFPKTNDAISIDNLRFIIASTEKRRLKKIRVIKS
jgi:magnesium and cobalt transporter